MSPKVQIIEFLKSWFTKTNVILYDDRIGFNCWDKEVRELRDGTKKEVYVVSFSTKSKIGYDEKGEINFFIDGMLCFAYFDAKTLELLYIHEKQDI